MARKNGLGHSTTSPTIMLENSKKLAKDYVPRIVKWIGECIADVKANLPDDCSTYMFHLDDDLVIAIGWSDGFAWNPSAYIQDPKDREKPRSCYYALCAKVCGKCAFPEYEWMDMPVETDGDHSVYDTDEALHPAMTRADMTKLARSLFRAYKDIRKGLDNGTLTIG